MRVTAQERDWNPPPSANTDMRPLIRLALWGTAAAGALALAAVSAMTGTGSQRMMLAMEGDDGPAEVAQIAPRPAEPSPETRRLSEAVRALGNDRERLQARVTLLERNLEDITGSIKRQPPVPPLADTATPAAPVVAPVATVAPAPTLPQPALPQPAPSQPAIEALDQTVPPSPPAPQAEVAALAPVPATTIASAEPAASANAASEPIGTDKPEFGADIGVAPGLEGLRTLWQSIRKSNKGRFEALYPLVATHENGQSHGAELHLIVGPLPGPEAVARLCKLLVAAHHPCQPASFEGQQLARADNKSKPAPKFALKSLKSALANPVSASVKNGPCSGECCRCPSHTP